jgi:hypothetical protein
VINGRFEGGRMTGSLKVLSVERYSLASGAATGNAGRTGGGRTLEA